MTDTLIIAGWALCGFLAYGLTLAYLQREFSLIADNHRNGDRWVAFLMAISGPVGLTISLFFRGHGFMWRLPPRPNP